MALYWADRVQTKPLNLRNHGLSSFLDFFFCIGMNLSNSGLPRRIRTQKFSCSSNIGTRACGLLENSSALLKCSYLLLEGTHPSIVARKWTPMGNESNRFALVAFGWFIGWFAAGGSSGWAMILMPVIFVSFVFNMKNSRI